MHSMLGRFRAVEVDQIYAYELLHRFVLSLIGIFIPIYIATNGMQINWVFNYILIATAAFAAACIPASYVIANIGFKHSLIASYFFYMPAFLALRTYSLSPTLVVAAAIAYGFGNAFHWISLHAEFATDTEQEGRGSASGKLIGLPKISQTIAPLAGGAIMAAFGFHALVSTSIGILILSAIPLFASKDHRDPLEYDLKSLFDSEHRKFAGLFLLRGADIAAAAILFPLFVFYIVGGEVSAGGAKSIASLGSIVFALTIGRITGRFGKKKLMASGLLLASIFYISRAFVQTATQAFAVSFFAGLFFMMYYVPLYSIYADVAEDEDILEFYAFREFFLNIGKLVTYGIATFFVLNYSVRTGFMAAFVYATVATVGIVGYVSWIEEEDEERKREDVD
ncbi:MFS transporter [Candidatus Nanohaloarchaea archaeon]|nr:MFS transporter [Candidatus Nanohaloarchaea archaeon]